MKYSNYLYILITAIPLYTAQSLTNNLPKSAIIIVGTGRCGSSCLAGVLNIMGVEFGDDLRKATQFNPKGTFEDWGTAYMTRDILRDEFDMNYWLSPKIIKWDQVANRENLKNKIKKYLKEHFSQCPIFAIKNSFLSFLIPLYAQAAIELGYTPKILVPARSPSETAHSWHKRPGITANMEQLYIMISKCLMSILEHSTKYDTLIVYYDELLNEPEKIIKQLNTFIPNLNGYNDVKKKINDFLDKSLKKENEQ